MSTSFFKCSHSSDKRSYSGKSESITIKNEKGRLSEEEIQRMVKEAEDFAAEDVRLPLLPHYRFTADPMDVYRRLTGSVLSRSTTSRPSFTV